MRYVNPWRVIESVLFEDTAGNITRILQVPPEWAQRLVKDYRGFAFTVAKYMAFDGDVKRLPAFSEYNYRQRIDDLNHSGEMMDPSVYITLNDVLRVAQKNPKLSAKLNSARDPETFFRTAKSAFDDFSKKTAGTVLMVFDNGFKWVGLGVGCSDVEGQMMQHCGRAGVGGELYSLRDSSENPHVTIEYHLKDNMIYQMSGKQNKPPDPKYYPYVKAFIDKTGADTTHESGVPEEVYEVEPWPTFRK